MRLTNWAFMTTLPYTQLIIYIYIFVVNVMVLIWCYYVIYCFVLIWVKIDYNFACGFLTNHLIKFMKVE